MYEGQRDQMMNQSFNMEQTNFATQSMKDTVVTVAAMKNANTALKSQMKSIKIEDVENLQDDMTDLLDQTNEIQDALGRSYGVGEVDEDELEDELAQLGEELDSEMPSYLSAVPSSEPESMSSTDPQLSAPLTN